ncbi:hypothetical protein QOT17_001644 [Balamuthia mandrillaris]
MWSVALFNHQRTFEEQATTYIKASHVLLTLAFLLWLHAPSVLKILNEDARLTNVKIVHDPGHLKNNFQKDLQKILGESQKGKKYSAKIGAWLMTAIKESERWAKMFTKQQAKETVAEYEERLRLEMVGEFQ